MAIHHTDLHILVNYHYITDSHEDFKGIHPCAIGEFSRQVEFLSKNFRVTSIPEVFHAAKAGLRENLCAITFDDGLKTQYRNALPLLKKHGMTATFFPITETFTGILPLTHTVHILLSKLSAEELIDMYNVFLYKFYPRLAADYSIPKDRRITYKRKMYDNMFDANFKETIIRLPVGVGKLFLMRVFEDLGLHEKAICQDLFLTPQEIRALEQDGFFVGSHTHSHNSLDNMSKEEALHEIRESKKLLTEVLTMSPTLFSYPHSASGEDIAAVLTDEGFTHAVTTERRAVNSNDTPLLIPRYDANDVRDFLAGLGV